MNSIIWIGLIVVAVILVVVLIPWNSESYHENPFRGYNLVQVNSSAGEIITGICLNEKYNIYSLFTSWNGKTVDLDWQVCNLPPDTWEFILFPHRPASIITFYSKSKPMQCSMINQARFVRRGTFGNYLYVFQQYMGTTHMRRVTPYSYILMGKPPAVELYMGMAPPIHPLKPTYDVMRCPNPPNVAAICRMAAAKAKAEAEAKAAAEAAATIASGVPSPSAPSPSAPLPAGEAAKESCCGN